jgi:tetratricopeptide (TPR) repeat protein
MSRRRILLAAVAVVLLGLGLRVANLADVADSPFFSRPVIDGQAYDQWARAIASGKAPAEPFYQDPLYPYFLAGVYRAFGHNFWAVYVIQLLLGVALILLVLDTTRLLFGPVAAVAAALLAALYKPFIFYDCQIEKTALAVFLTGLLVWLTVRTLKPREHSPYSPVESGYVVLVWPFATGVALGLAALTRANLLLFAPLLILALMSRPLLPAPHSSLIARRSSFRALAALAGIVLVIVPVSVRNSILAREFVLTTAQAGQNLYIGNSPYNNTGQYQAPPWVRPNPEFEQADFAEYARRQAGKDLTHGEVSRFYVRAALDWMRTHPAAFLRNLGRKLVLYFNNFEVPDNQDMYFFARYSWVLRLPLPGFGIIFGLGMAGLVITREKRNRQGRKADSLARTALAVFFFGYAATVIVFFVFSRYRIPALPALLPFAGAMLASSLGVVRRSSFTIHHSALSAQRSSFIPSLLLASVCFAVTHYPVRRGPGTSEAAQCLVNLASMYFQEGDTGRAVATFHEALAVRPGLGEALRNLGIIALSRKDVSQAAELLARAVRAEPANPVTHHYLGKAFELRRMPDSALSSFRHAVELAPGRVEYRFSLATALQQLGRYPEALAQYDTMLQLAPDNPLVHHNLAVACYNLGRIADARRELEAARRLGGPVNPQFEQAVRNSRP